MSGQLVPAFPQMLSELVELGPLSAGDLDGGQRARLIRPDAWQSTPRPPDPGDLVQRLPGRPRREEIVSRQLGAGRLGMSDRPAVLGEEELGGHRPPPAASERHTQ
ncbi:MAG: hypothetical protein ACRDYX_14855 [Egibacteraceae bacterium]